VSVTWCSLLVPLVVLCTFQQIGGILSQILTARQLLCVMTQWSFSACSQLDYAVSGIEESFRDFCN
jgi:hypothetical protein